VRGREGERGSGVREREGEWSERKSDRGEVIRGMGGGPYKKGA
jgi:hypothetical protein